MGIEEWEDANEVRLPGAVRSNQDVDWKEFDINRFDTLKSFYGNPVKCSHGNLKKQWLVTSESLSNHFPVTPLHISQSEQGNLYRDWLSRSLSSRLIPRLQNIPPRLNLAPIRPISVQSAQLLDDARTLPAQILQLRAISVHIVQLPIARILRDQLPILTPHRSIPLVLPIQHAHPVVPVIKNGGQTRAL